MSNLEKTLQKMIDVHGPVKVGGMVVCVSQALPEGNPDLLCIHLRAMLAKRNKLKEEMEKVEAEIKAEILDEAHAWLYDWKTREITMAVNEISRCLGLMKQRKPS
jgi:hypothetical protein